MFGQQFSPPGTIKLSIASLQNNWKGLRHGHSRYVASWVMLHVFSFKS